MAGRLFISHANGDSATADKIVAYLEAHGVPCWIASRDIPPRAVYAEAIVDAIEACSACAVLVTADANKSDAIKREVELASHGKKPFIPVRVDGAEPSRGLAYYLRNIQWIEYKRDGTRALDRIVAHLGSGAAAPQAPAHTPPPAAAPAPEEKNGLGAVTAIGAGLILLIVWVITSVMQNSTTQQTATTEVSAEAAPASDQASAPQTTSPNSVVVGQWILRVDWRWGDLGMGSNRRNTWPATFFENGEFEIDGERGRWDISDAGVIWNFNSHAGGRYVGRFSGDELSGAVYMESDGRQVATFVMTRAPS